MIIYQFWCDLYFVFLCWFSYMSFILYQTWLKVLINLCFVHICPITTGPLTICVCFADVVNLNLKSTLRVLYNLFTNYKNSD